MHQCSKESQEEIEIEEKEIQKEQQECNKVKDRFIFHFYLSRSSNKRINKAQQQQQY
jgi:hypothetical protein